MANVITMPKLGLTMTEGVIICWHKKTGDMVKKGDIIFELETDKITNQVEALNEGILRKILAEEGSVVPVGGPVAILAALDEPLPEDVYEAGTDKSSRPLATAAPFSTPAGTNCVSKTTTSIKASPAAKKMACEHGVDLTVIQPSRTDGRIVEKDVLAYLETLSDKVAASESTKSAGKVCVTPVAKQLAQELGIDLTKLTAAGRINKEDIFTAWLSTQGKEQPDSDHREPLAGVRRIIAEHMSKSKRIAPHVTYNLEIDMSKAKAIYKVYKARDHKISYNDLVVFAAARTLRRFPLVNASLSNEDIIYHHYIHVGVAVALESGLIVPVVKNADQKSLYDLGQEIRDLATRTRQNKLTPDEIKGGTFTVTNLGMYGIDSFTPIINQPESAILGVCRIVDKPVVENDIIVIKPIMNLSLSADHRLVDGAVAAQFLSQIKIFLEEPALLL